MLQNKALRWLLALIYIVLFVWMWLHSKDPTWKDVPVLFGAGLMLSLLCLIPFNRKANSAFMILNVVLLIGNIVMYFAAYRLVSSAFKN